MRVRKSRKTVLVVDDEPTIARIVGLHLRRAGFEVLVFTSPREVLSYWEQFPDRVLALVTDLSMPLMSGLELADALRQGRPCLPVLFLTGHSQWAVEVLEHGGDCAVLSKPFQRLDLVRGLTRLLGLPLSGSRPDFPAIAS
jgi:CheY-like chemotaxis protein